MAGMSDPLVDLERTVSRFRAWLELRHAAQLESPDDNFFEIDELNVVREAFGRIVIDEIPPVARAYVIARSKMFLQPAYQQESDDKVGWMKGDGRPDLGITAPATKGT